MTTLAVAILLGGLVMFLISLPLIYRKIPMNHFYPNLRTARGRSIDL
jgi:peptidoglycan biosynthesis protein MviN/MurJ (putative lipid II flippase)